MNNSQKIANIIKELAKSRKVSVAKMLADCQLNKNSLYTMQTEGYSPRVDTLVKIADYLGCSVDFLLGRDSQNTLVMTNVHDNINFAAQTAAPVGDSLSAQERDLLQIFRNASGKKQVEIMQFIYGMENN